MSSFCKVERFKLLNSMAPGRGAHLTTARPADFELLTIAVSCENNHTLYRDGADILAEPVRSSYSRSINFCAGAAISASTPAVTIDYKADGSAPIFLVAELIIDRPRNRDQHNELKDRASLRKSLVRLPKRSSASQIAR